MKKKALEKIKPLQATRKMMMLAKADTLTVKKFWGGDVSVYERGLYIRCTVQGDILKAAFFLAEHMRLGGKNPAYEIYFDFKKRAFITYDHLQSKWINAQINNISLPRYVFHSDEMWISSKDNAKIKKCLGVNKGGYSGLVKYQWQIREEELLRRYKRETDPWDADLAQMTEKLPRDWTHWVSKVGIRENYIYYNYQKNGAKTGYCTYCDKDVPLRKQPYHDKSGVCSCCRKKITYKAIGRAGYVVTQETAMYLIQQCSSGIVIREFFGKRIYNKGEYKTPICVCDELRRVLYDADMQNPRAYYWGQYKQRQMRWIKNSLRSPGGHYWYNHQGKTYGKTLQGLAKGEVSRTGMLEVIHDMGICDPEKYLAIWNAFPQIEKIAKAGFPRLLECCVNNYWEFGRTVADKNAGSMTKMLGVNKQELKRIRANNGDFDFIAWIKHERMIKGQIPDKVIWWFCGEKIAPRDLKFIGYRMSVMQVYNYLLRQIAFNHCSSKDVLIKWRDYLAMAKKLKMDTGDAIVYRVNKLFQRHDELVVMCNAEDFMSQAKKIHRKFPAINKICQSLKAKYEYSNKDYMIIAPESLEDILNEGRELNHCVANNDRYWERIVRKEAYILFLRRADNPSKSYYTLEIEPDGTVRQKRTYFDRQEKDIKDASLFLIEWQMVVAQRLTSEDKVLANESRNLRNIEFAELRKSRAVIQTGDLAGQLLVDVLMADLMEAAA